MEQNVRLLQSRKFWPFAVLVTILVVPLYQSLLWESTQLVPGNSSSSSSVLRERNKDKESELHTEENEDHTEQQVNTEMDEVVHITHFFSSYSIQPPNLGFYEQKVVQKSWQVASEYAFKKSGLKIEFIDCTPESDTEMSPSYARRFNLNRWIDDPHKGKVPTVGEPFEVAFDNGRGEVFIYTNADIGVLPEFYVRAHEWATRDYATRNAQLDAMKEAARYAAACFLEMDPTVFNQDHADLCAEDTKVFYVHSGGFLDLWSEVGHEIAIEAAKLWQQHSRQEVLYRRFFDMLRLLSPSKGEGFEEQHGPNKQWRSIIATRLMQGPDNSKLDKLRDQLFAGTITRVEPEFDIAKEAVHGIDEMYQRVLKAIPQTGEKHPGNDCFVFNRKSLPRVAKVLGHPTGKRPWGLWLTWAWWFQGTAFRRIGGTKQNPLTFHIGKGLWGLDKDQWKSRAESDEDYALFLASNFERLSKGVLKTSFTSSPAVCQTSTAPWRSSQYCGLVREDYCAGITRFGCYYQSHLYQRDSIWYFNACLALHKRSEGIYMRPTCNFCNMMFELRSLDKHITCSDGQLPYCQGFGNVPC